MHHNSPFSVFEHSSGSSIIILFSAWRQALRTVSFITMAIFTKCCISYSGFFDQAFSEYVILGSDFMEDFEWKCINGGSTVLVSAMLGRIAP